MVVNIKEENAEKEKGFTPQPHPLSKENEIKKRKPKKKKVKTIKKRKLK